MKTPTLVLMPVLLPGALLLGGCLGGCTAREARGTETHGALARPNSAGGASNGGETANVAAIQKMKLTSPVVARGTMVEKCPIAGCWFKLHDPTGIIKVDLKATKLNVLDKPLNSEVTVRGKVVQNGSEKMIQAASATF